MTQDTMRKLVYEYGLLDLPDASYPRFAELNRLAREGWDVVLWDTKDADWRVVLRRERAMIHMSIVAKGDNGNA